MVYTQSRLLQFQVLPIAQANGHTHTRQCSRDNGYQLENLPGIPKLIRIKRNNEWQ